MYLQADRPEPVASHTTTNPERQHARSTPVVPAAVRTEQPRPPVRSTLAVGGTVYLGWEEPHLTKTPWELERHKKQKAIRITQPEFPTRFFKNLPREVYECIVTQLEQLHLAQDQSCPACHLRDLHNLSLVSRAWDKATIPRM